MAEAPGRWSVKRPAIRFVFVLPALVSPLMVAVARSARPAHLEDRHRSASPFRHRRAVRGRTLVADAPTIPPEAEVRARWDSFAWSEDNQRKRNAILDRYPKGREQSASLPLLDLAQRQVGEETQTQTQGWLPVPVIEFVAREIGVPYMRVYEVATFYTMFNLAPVGRWHVQVCGTTPCVLRGSDDVIAACKARGMAKGATTADRLWTLTEVECMGNCASAPMVQINDDNYEDLTYDRTLAILDALAAGGTPKPGTQEPGRHTVEPVAALSSLTAMVDANHDYRPEWNQEPAHG